MRTVSGVPEVPYLVGAIRLVQSELAVATRRQDLARMMDASERLSSLKDALYRVVASDATLDTTLLATEDKP
jgi:hypothetical protein